MDALTVLEDRDAYVHLFTDVNLWRPYVLEVCQRHPWIVDTTDIQDIRVGVPGTYPAFIVGERWLVKFFGRLFEGGRAFEVEQAANRLAALDPRIQAARLLGVGQLGNPGSGWPWPYLIFEFVPGTSIGEVAGKVSQEDWRRVAREMGLLAWRLHALPINGSTVFAQEHEPYLRFLAAQRATCVANQRAWGTLPSHLIEQIDSFLPAPESLLEVGRPPHLIHADLTRDHLLGKIENGRWQTLALIDFGDARSGSLYYEMAALHLDLLRGERPLLAEFLDAYGINEAERAALPRKALATALLHQFNVFAGLAPQRLQVETLEILAEEMWGVITIHRNDLSLCQAADRLHPTKENL